MTTDGQPHHLPLKRINCPLSRHDGSVEYVRVWQEDGTAPDPPWLGVLNDVGIELFVGWDADAALLETSDRTLLLSWNASGCTTTAIAEKAGIHGLVRGPLPFAESWVHGCGSKASIDEESRFFLLARTEPCRLQVVGRDNGFSALGPALDVLPQAGADLEVVLEAPTTMDRRGLTDAEYASLLTRIELSRQLADENPKEPTYAEQLAILEALRADVDAAREQP